MDSASEFVTSPKNEPENTVGVSLTEKTNDVKKIKLPELINESTGEPTKKWGQFTKKPTTKPFKQATAQSLVRYIKVTPLRKNTRPPQARASQQSFKTVGAEESAARPKEIQHKKHFSSSPFTHILPEERPDWTATLHDMTKDLIHNRKNICKDITEIPQNIKVDVDVHTLNETLGHLPFHTLLVKWKFNFNFPAYTPRIVFGILSRFGKIDAMGSLSHNSAFVIFHWEYHACRAVMARLVGFGYCPLILSWMFIDRYRYALRDASEVKREDMMLSDGRQARNTKRHIAQIKKDFWRKAASLSYDVSSFRP